MILLRSAFDENGLANECTLSNGDSGGGAFISDGGVWKLAGIHYARRRSFYTAPSASTQFDAALFDMFGFLRKPGQRRHLQSHHRPAADSGRILSDAHFNQAGLDL